MRNIRAILEYDPGQLDTFFQRKHGFLARVRRYRDHDYPRPYPDQRRGDWNSGYDDTRGIDRAINTCVDEDLSVLCKIFLHLLHVIRAKRLHEFPRWPHISGNELSGRADSLGQPDCPLIDPHKIALQLLLAEFDTISAKGVGLYDIGTR